MYSIAYMAKLMTVLISTDAITSMDRTLSPWRRRPRPVLALPTPSPATSVH